jgi:hypothetical protein
LEGKSQFKVTWRDGVEYFNTYDQAIKFAMKVPLPIIVIHYHNEEIIYMEMIE